MAILTPEERIGTTIAEKYRVDAVLGEGGWGVVFAGMHLWTDREVAIKLLHAQHARKDLIVKRFLKEAKAAARIKHPNVVDVLDMGRDEGDVYLVLERLHGQTLGDLLLKKELLSPRETLDILLPILDALTEAHDRKIVHRDLKPDNIFLANERDRVVPKLLDFGIAKMMEGEGANTTTGSVVGTPSYMSPEQVQGALDIRPAADVWSMGVVLYECLTGSLPFEAHNVAAVLIQILTKPPPTLASVRPELGSELSDVLEKAMSWDAAKRYASARELRDALVALPAIEAATAAPRAPRNQVDEHEQTHDFDGEAATSATLSAISRSGQMPSPTPEEPSSTPEPDEPVPSASASRTPELSQPVRVPTRSLVPVAVGAALLAVVGVVVMVASTSSDDPEPAPIAHDAPADVAPVIAEDDAPAVSPRVEDDESAPAPVAELPAEPEPAVGIDPPAPTRPRTRHRTRPQALIGAPSPPSPLEVLPPPSNPRPREERGTNDALIID